MKNIKKFKELNSSTYKSAADKMHNIGLHKRAQLLDDYSKDVYNMECFNNYISNISDCKKYGTFEIEYKGVKYEVTPKFSERYYEDLGYDFKIACKLYGDKLFNISEYGVPFFDIIGDDHGVYDIEFVSNFTITNRIRIDRRNARKLKNILIANFKENEEELVESVEEISINEFYRESTYEELDTTNYVKVADKLRSKHPERARKLIDHAELVELQNKRKEYKLNLIKMDSNRFNINIESYRYSKKNGKFTTTKVLDSYNNCALYIYFDPKENYYNLSEAEQELESGDTRGCIEFYLKFMPESYDDYINIDTSDPTYLYFYYNLNKGSLKITSLSLSNFSFSDRKSSGRFLKIIKDIVDKKITYKNDSTKDMSYDIEYNFLAKYGVSSEYGLSMDDFVQVINKTSANELYREV